MTSRPYQSTTEKCLRRDLARARDALAMAYSGLDRARADDPYFDIDKRMALVREDMDYLDREHGGARHQDGQHVALAEPDVSDMNLGRVHDNINYGGGRYSGGGAKDGLGLAAVPGGTQSAGDNDDGGSAA